MRIDHLEIGPGRIVVTTASHDTTTTCERCGRAGVYAITTDDGSRDVRVGDGPVEVLAAELPVPAELGLEA